MSEARELQKCIIIPCQPAAPSCPTPIHKLSIQLKRPESAKPRAHPHAAAGSPSPMWGSQSGSSLAWGCGRGSAMNDQQSLCQREQLGTDGARPVSQVASKDMECGSSSRDSSNAAGGWQIATEYCCAATSAPTASQRPSTLTGRMGPMRAGRRSPVHLKSGMLRERPCSKVSRESAFEQHPTVVAALPPAAGGPAAKQAPRHVFRINARSTACSKHAIWLGCSTTDSRRLNNSKQPQQQQAARGAPVHAACSSATPRWQTACAASCAPSSCP